jgi:excisionase family DNA binding protein
MVGWFSIAGASAYCSTSKRTVEMWIKEEGLRISRVRGKRLIKKEFLDEFLEKHESGNGKKVDQIVDETLKDLNL